MGYRNYINELKDEINKRVPMTEAELEQFVSSKEPKVKMYWFEQVEIDRAASILLSEVVAGI